MATKNHKPRPPHSDLILRKASDYLEFDIHSLAAAIDLYRRARGTELGNAALDSLLVRARVLIDFFMTRGALHSDVVAIDYFHDFKRKPYRPRMPRTVGRERGKINKRIMHLTTKPMPRLRSNQRYAFDGIARPIVQCFRDWLTVVPGNRLQRPAAKVRADYERHLRRIERAMS